MLLQRIGITTSKSVAPRILYKFIPRCCGQSFLQYSKAQPTNVSENNEDKPIPYLKSQAADWKAEYARIPPHIENRSWITPYSVLISTAAFLIYFLILREENDLDEILYRPLPETIKGIEKHAPPNTDFYTLPDYVRYHDAQKKAKLEQKRTKESE